MGCLSSKITARSGSFHGELKQNLQRVGGLEDPLASSKNKGDHFLAHLSTANTVSVKLDSASIDADHRYMGELLAGLEQDSTDECINTTTSAEDKSWRMKSMAKELAALRVDPAFEFSKSGSLRGWLQQGGQVFSPGSYVTPKFGGSVAPVTEDGVVFDTAEMVAHIEEELTVEEECIIEEILESLEGGNEEGSSSMSDTIVNIQIK